MILAGAALVAAPLAAAIAVVAGLRGSLPAVAALLAVVGLAVGVGLALAP